MAHQSLLRSLEILFGGIPKLIEENVKYLHYNDENDDFTCVLCDKIIQKASNADNTTNNFVKHFESNAHINQSTSTNDVLTRLNFTFYGNVPPIVLMNVDKLSINGVNYECVICEKNIMVSANTTTTENNFSYHLLSDSHHENLKYSREILSQLDDIYGGISQTILNHSRFLSKNGKHYLCMICNKQLMVHPTDVEETEKCFEKHLHSLKHIRNAKQSKAFSLIPELQIIFFSLPNYMFRNLEYLSINGLHIFCSLCNENIKLNKNDGYETKLNFKQHFLSPSHEEKLNNRKDPNNELVQRLVDIFEDLPSSFQKHLQHLSMNENDFYCEICEETINKYDEPEETKESLALHFESSYHETMISFKEDRTVETYQELNDVFGSIPEMIQDNLQHIEFTGSNNFECNLCNKTLKAKFDSDYEENTRITENNFQQHLESNGHNYELEKFEEINNNILGDLEDMFSPIPQYITNNINHLGYDDNDNFVCVLCDKMIAVVPGNKKSKLTEQNFRNHFFSSGHFAKLKHNANLIMDVTEKLEIIFNKTPNFILSNIHYIEFQEVDYRCILCDVTIKQGGAESTEKQFRQHLFGSNHKSNLENIEHDNDKALQELNQMFWRVPEFLLRNIDFLQTVDEDLFCILCQEQLPIDEEDLEETKQSLRNHIESESHLFTLRNI